MRSGHLDNGHLSYMKNTIDFREVVDFTRYELLGHVGLLTPSGFSELTDDKKTEVYERAWQAVMDACTYMTSALNIDELQTKHH